VRPAASERSASGRAKASAPPDDAAERAYEEILKRAELFGLVVQAYGGVATIAIPREQRSAGIRARVLEAHVMVETKAVLR